MLARWHLRPTESERSEWTGGHRLLGLLDPPSLALAARSERRKEVLLQLFAPWVEPWRASCASRSFATTIDGAKLAIKKLPIHMLPWCRSGALVEFLGLLALWYGVRRNDSGTNQSTENNPSPAKRYQNLLIDSEISDLWFIHPIVRSLE